MSGQRPATAPERGEPQRLLLGHVRRVDQAPARVDAEVEEPFDRAAAELRDAFLDFLRLLGGVDVDRPGRRRIDHDAQRLRRHGAQRMRRDADARIGQTSDDLLRARDEFEEPLGVVDEAALSVGRRRAAEPAVGVERRQQGQADPGLRRGRGNARRHLAEIGIGPAVDVVMQIVELGDRREAGFQHLHIGEGRDRLDVIGREPREEAVHHLAPGPEAVGGRPAALGEAGHAALERVAVQVGQAGAAQRRRRCSAPALAAFAATRHDDGRPRRRRARRAPSRPAAMRGRSTDRARTQALQRARH